MSPHLAPLWVYLQATPLSGLSLTLVACVVAEMVSRRLKHPVLAAPPIVAMALVAAALLATGTPYHTYFLGAQYVHFLLGPATVALAVPMYANLARIRRAAGAIFPALLAGSLTSAGSAMLIAKWLGAPRVLILSLAPKSVTTPIAMGIAEKIGGQPSLAAAFVMMSAMIGIVLMAPVFRVFRITDPRAQGLAAGTVAHGLATSRMLLVSELAGAFGGLAIGINGIASALFLPVLAQVLGLNTP